ncbi:MAG TPA: putative zinc-binding metallopeptidase, partial [Thermoanaerobaculia bacterium]|nr:putative zinc-binding metallopeptidase [Thermoanaerobaculia bacterium]
SAAGPSGTRRPIRDLGLTIEGTPLAAVLDAFVDELDRAGICPLLRPRFYLSTEWGVPFGTIAIAIPFYLARPDLTALHAERTGFVEGVGRADLLRYLRHEMGHVVNYAYLLYEREEWVEAFGPITRPYREEYRPEPFSRRYVRHLPGWYAQKHPDEDWAETFAVWMTPGRDWRVEYAGWPEALAKLELCDHLMAELAGCTPPVTADDLDEDVGEIAATLDEFYGGGAEGTNSPQGSDGELPPGLDGALRAIFEDLGRPEESPEEVTRRPAAALIQRLVRTLPAEVFRWTGHFPERTRALLFGMVARAEELAQVYPEDREGEAVLGITVLVTALACNHVHRGHYAP